MEDLRGHVAKKVSHKPHLFFAHMMSIYINHSRERALLHAPSEIHSENSILLPLLLSML